MASKDYALLDIQDENDEINMQFQDLPTNDSADDDKTGQTVYFSNFPDSYTDDVEERDDDQLHKSSLSMWTFEYYQHYFNVSTRQVIDRVIWSTVPKPGVNYLERYIRPNPDLYGPIWISITLIFTTAIIGNLVNYLDSSGNHWRYDFHKVTLAASTIFSYTFLVPIAVWGILLWKGSRATFSLFELICIYGYSLSIFVPVSILWIVPLPWLQWCLGIVSSVVSGSVLIRTIVSAVPHEKQKFGVAAVVFIVHAGLALSFMLFFFNHASSGLDTAPSLPQQGNVLNSTLDNVARIHKNISNIPSTISKRNEDDVLDSLPPIVKPSFQVTNSIKETTVSLGTPKQTMINAKTTVPVKEPIKFNATKTHSASVSLNSSSILGNHM